MSLLDPKWKYTHSTATDIRKTFAKARRELAKKQQQEAAGSQPKLHLMGGRQDAGHLQERNESQAAPRLTSVEDSLFGSTARELRGQRRG